jgi:hypothetical protein
MEGTVVVEVTAGVQGAEQGGSHFRMSIDPQGGVLRDDQGPGKQFVTPLVLGGPIDEVFDWQAGSAGAVPELALSEAVAHVYQIPVAGIRPAGIMQHGSVSLHPLSDRERGAFVDEGFVNNWPVVGREFVKPRSTPNFVPNALQRRSQSVHSQISTRCHMARCTGSS